MPAVGPMLDEQLEFTDPCPAGLLADATAIRQTEYCPDSDWMTATSVRFLQAQAAVGCCLGAWKHRSLSKVPVFISMLVILSNGNFPFLLFSQCSVSYGVLQSLWNGQDSLLRRCRLENLGTTLAEVEPT